VDDAGGSGEALTTAGALAMATIVFVFFFFKMY
jgi:hypothetical protein